MIARLTATTGASGVTVSVFPDRAQAVTLPTTVVFAVGESAKSIVINTKPQLQPLIVEIIAADIRTPSARAKALVQVTVLGRNDPIGFVMKFTRSSNPDLWRSLEALGVTLCLDPDVATRHIEALQAFDMIAQKQRGLAALLRADCPVAALAALGLEELKFRLGSPFVRP